MSIHAARVDPSTGQLLDPTELGASSNGDYEFTLHVHGLLQAWRTSDLANVQIQPALAFDLAPDLP